MLCAQYRPSELDKLIANGDKAFHDDPINSDLLTGAVVRCLVSSHDHLSNGILEFHCVSQLDKRYLSEFFERCGINPEMGGNSKILLVHLSTINTSLISTADVLSNLCLNLGIRFAISQSGNTAEEGAWMVSGLQAIRTELVKCGVSLVAKELLAALSHDPWQDKADYSDCCLSIAAKTQK